MNATAILTYGYQTVLQTIEGLPEPDWVTGGVCGAWSVKDIIAHLTSYEHLLVEVLLTLLERGPTPTIDMVVETGLAFNDIQVEMRQENSPAEVLTEYTETHLQVLMLFAQIPAEMIRQKGALPWYGPDFDLEDFIVYTNYAHKREHCAEINIFRNKLRNEAKAES